MNYGLESSSCCTSNIDEERGAKMGKENDGCSETQNNDCLVPTCMRKIVVRCLKNKDKSVYLPK